MQAVPEGFFLPLPNLFQRTVGDWELPVTASLDLKTYFPRTAESLTTP